MAYARDSSVDSAPTFFHSEVIKPICGYGKYICEITANITATRALSRFCIKPNYVNINLQEIVPIYQMYSATSFLCQYIETYICMLPYFVIKTADAYISNSNGTASFTVLNIFHVISVVVILFKKDTAESHCSGACLIK